jgi:hypothetical protein
MENLIALLGMLFFIFLVLAASVEVILEVLRGVLDSLGFTWAQGKMSLGEALRFSSEFSPNTGELNTKLQAVKSAAEQVPDKAQARLNALNALGEKLQAELSPKALELVAAEINALAAAVKRDIESSERSRVFILRLAAAVLGCGLVFIADFQVFRMLANAQEAQGLLASVNGLQAQWVNVLVGGLAAAAGSSYWHDKLDKVRAIKALISESKSLAP